MTFVAGFYSFNLDIVDASSNRYESVRVKIPRHPEETEAYLHARVLAYAHAYREGLEFSPGLFEPKAPTFFASDLFGNTTRWIQLGAPEKEKIQKMLRHHKEAECSVYFLNWQQVDKFCHYLRGSTSNWVAPVRCYLLDEGFLEASGELLQSSSRWSLNFIDGSVFAVINGSEFETTVETVDIWERFQQTIANA
jgi:uncharacterized protein YaeQ